MGMANMYSEFPKESKHSRKRTEPNMPPLNDLTWSELAKRYISSILFTTEDHNNSDKACEHMDIFRCLCADGGPKCGALNEVDGFEADALLFATSTNRIYGSLNADSDMLAVDDLDSDEKNTELDQSTVLNKGIRVWVHHLEPVKGLKTNNGAKIKKCIMNSLKNEPPREILEHSVNKEVYEGNTSGMAKFWRYVLIGFPDLFMFSEASDEFESSCIKEVVALHWKLKVDNQLEKQKQQKLWNSNTANLSRLSRFCRQDNIVPPAIEHVSPPWRKNYMERGNALSSWPLKEKEDNMFFLMIASQPIG